MRINQLIERLERERTLEREELIELLSPSLPGEAAAMLRQKAREVTDRVFGNRVRIRGLIEVTNVCRNNCYYCGLRKSNRTLRRYTLTPDRILECCAKGYDAGFRTFVLQGGENPAMTRRDVVEIVESIKRDYPDVAVTLSLGEWERDDYAAFRQAGADRYLLRHETRDSGHYSRLHPPEMSLTHRLQCLEWLKETGFQTGTGIMVGAPGQTAANIATDLLYMAGLKPEMIGIGPFIPNGSTPFAGEKSGSVELTIRLISMLRLMFPGANIPATTALATLSPGRGRVEGLLAGANVVMPNLSPPEVRADYALYDNKAAWGIEAAEGISRLADELRRAGLEITKEKGDFENV